MKARKSVIKKYSVEDLKNMGTKGAKEIVAKYGHTRGHDMELLVSVWGDRNVELGFKDIVIETDAYCKKSKTATEIKSNYGSKTYAQYRALIHVLEVYALQELTNCRKIKDYILFGINNNITRKYGMDYNETSYSLKDFKERKPHKVRGWINNQKDMDCLIEEAYESATALIKKMEEVNNVE